jgi:glycogen operon protein
LAGDEFFRTQNGNNNAWCQDNAISWIDWSLAEKHSDLLRFTKKIIELRKRHPGLRRETFPQGEGPNPDIIWHGASPNEPDFSANSHALAFALDGRNHHRGGDADRDLYVAMNAWTEELIFEIPESPTKRPWRLTVQTAANSPEDIYEQDQGPVVQPGDEIKLPAFSMVILVSDS